MYGKILSIDKDHDAVIQLPSGEKVYIGGGPVTDYVFLCTAFQKNMFGMPIKKIWHFFMFDSRGEKEGAAFWNAVAPFVKAAGKENVVFLDFYEYPPKYVLFGYVMHFDSIEQMKIRMKSGLKLTAIYTLKQLIQYLKIKKFPNK